MARFCGTLGDLLGSARPCPGNKIVDPDTLREIGRCGIGAAISMPSRSFRAA
jgi:hypothetical protein